MMENLDLLKSRHSVRSYLRVPIEDAIKNKLRSYATFVNTHEAGIRLILVFDDESPFKGFHSYGVFKGVNNYLAVIVDSTFDNARERAGYYAEEFAIEALQLGISTCFVGGTFSREHIKTEIEVYEKVPFVVSFGYAEENKKSLIGVITEKILHRNTMRPREFFSGDDSEYQMALAKLPWLPEALEAAAVAPSALNSQPVRISLVKNYIDDFNCFDANNSQPAISAFTIAPDKYDVELGIAKFNIAFAVGGSWDWGENGVFYPDSEK